MNQQTAHDENITKLQNYLLNTKSSESVPYLHTASMLGNINVVKVLLKNGNSANITDQMNRTPLHIACMHNHAEIVHLLLQNDANLRAKDKDGKTPEFYISERQGSAVKNVIKEFTQNGKETLDLLINKLNNSKRQQKNSLKKSRICPKTSIPKLSTNRSRKFLDTLKSETKIPMSHSSEAECGAKEPKKLFGMQFEAKHDNLASTHRNQSNQIQISCNKIGTTSEVKAQEEDDPLGLNGLEDLADNMSLDSDSDHKGGLSSSGSMDDILQQLKDIENDPAALNDVKGNFYGSQEDIDSIRAHAQLVTEDDAIDMMQRAVNQGKVFTLTEIGKEIFDKFTPDWDLAEPCKNNDEEEREKLKRGRSSPSSAVAIRHPAGETKNSLLAELALRMQELDEDSNSLYSRSKSPPGKRSRYHI